MNGGSGVSIGGVKIVRVHLSYYEVEGDNRFHSAWHHLA